MYFLRLCSPNFTPTLKLSKVFHKQVFDHPPTVNDFIGFEKQSFFSVRSTYFYNPVLCFSIRCMQRPIKKKICIQWQKKTWTPLILSFVSAPSAGNASAGSRVELSDVVCRMLSGKVCLKMWAPQPSQNNKCDDCWKTPQSSLLNVNVKHFYNWLRINIM